MRNSQMIKLDEDRIVTVQELRVKDVRQLLSGFTDLDKLDVAALLGPRFTEIAELIQPFVKFPKDESLDDLTGSELQQVVDGFKEVNKAFLTLAGMAPAAAPKPEARILTSSAAD